MTQTTKRGVLLAHELGLGGIEFAAMRCSQLSRLARTFANIQVNRCNLGDTPELMKRHNAYAKHITDLVRTLQPQITALHLGGDPRGYTVKLVRADGRYNTMGGAEDGWGIA